MKILDAAALCLALCVFAVFSFYTCTTAGTQPAAHIVAGREEWFYPLAEERTIAVTGPAGETVIVITGGAMSVDSSPCREQICVKHSRIAKPGEWIACLPNQVLINIEAARSDKFDAISY